MEIRARYVLIGLFVLAVIVGGFGFVFWLNNAGSLGERTTYRVEFDGSIAGLYTGSPVLFNGLSVGEVTRLSLDASNPGAVMATIAVDSRTPVKSDTHVGLIFAGLTGTATVALSGGTADSPLPASANGQPPLLVADTASLKDMTQAARDVLGQINDVVTQNSEAFKVAVTNIAAFSEALGRNSSRVDGILEGLERLTGGKTAPEPTTYDLSPPTTFANIPAIPDKQLAIATPTAVIILDTQRIVVQSADGVAPAFPDARFADNLPALFQTRFVQAFENANYLKAGADGGDLEGDYKLAIDIRKFQLATTPTASAEVEFSAKLLDSGGKVVDAKIFTASSPASATDNAGIAAKALNDAFDKATADLVVWSLAAMDAHADDAPAADDKDLDLPPPSDDLKPPADAAAPDATPDAAKPDAAAPATDAPADTTAPDVGAPATDAPSPTNP
jgi:phospholipid/cholesterol/gamma-HCH transport system substrate-binding protein